MLKEFNQKPNKMCVDKGSEFYNRSMKSWLEKSDIETYSKNNDGKSVVAERFIRTLKIHLSLLTSHVVLDYDLRQVVISVLNLHLYYFI